MPDNQKLNLDPAQLEQALRTILDAYNNETGPCSGPKWLINLTTAINKAQQTLNTIYRCKFQWDNGAGCIEPGTRDVHNVWCCEHHAQIRERG